nr:myb-binding protein 1A [Neomonachus schauinslandi]
MAEMERRGLAESVSPAGAAKSGPQPADREGLLKQSREFLDFFWDIAKPEQETRLGATEKLLEYLRARPQGAEMKYALKRLISGLGVGRETARPCYSLALAQLLQSFEDIPLCSVLQQIQEKHDLQKVKKAMMRPALFANLFGVLALFQSGRLVKDSEALMKSIKLLQTLAQHYNHLQEQPQKALVDILSEVPEATLQAILPKVLKADLNSVLGSPEHLELFLLAQQKVPEKLKELMGPVNLFSDENIPRLVSVLKTAASSVKKERKLPAVALDLLRLSLQEGRFPRFWKEVVEQGLLKKQFWPASYLCFRLLGAALPLLSKEQLALVMQGDLIRHFGEHTVTAKVGRRWVWDALSTCPSQGSQLAVSCVCGPLDEGFRAEMGRLHSATPATQGNCVLRCEGSRRRDVASPAESCDLLGDIQTCIKKSLGEKTRRTRSKAATPQEPPWVEVLVEILLALLAQPSHLMRQVARSVFSHICAHLTPRALQLILDVLNPDKSPDEDSVVITDDSEKQLESGEDKSSDSEDERHSAGEEDSGEEDSDEEDRDGDVDQGFREQLMAVLQAGKALGAVDGEDDDDEELGDEAMMALDQSLASLFAEQKLRIQARKDEKNKLRKEKVLRRDFQIRVLDLVEVLVTKQPENPLVLELLEPLLDVIRRSMRTSSSKQEQDLLHKTARIFTHLCRSRHCCHDVGRGVGSLYAQVGQLVQQAGRQADASVSLYHFNAALYLLRVLKGGVAAASACQPQKKEKAGPRPKGPEASGCLDLSLVTPIYSSALTSFLTRRNSPLTIPMFLSLFSRHPVLCKSLLPVVIQHVTGQARPRHQAQACVLLQKALPTRELRLCFEDPEWEQLVSQVLAQVTENLRTLGEARTKSEQQKELSSLGLLNTLFRTIHQEKLTVDLTAVLGVLQSQQQKLPPGERVGGSSRLCDLYWQAMKALGVQRPKAEKKDTKEVPSVTQSPVSTKRKKKGFLPETKKRKKRKSEGAAPEEEAKPAASGGDQPPSTGKKRRNKRKARSPAQAQATPATKRPVPDTTSTGPATPATTPKLQKKKRRLSQGHGATAGSPAAPVGKKPPQKDLPEKGVSGKSPQSALPRKKARLSLVSRSPSLLQSGAKRKKASLKKARKP